MIYGDTTGMIIMTIHHNMVLFNTRGEWITSAYTMVYIHACVYHFVLQYVSDIWQGLIIVTILGTLNSSDNRRELMLII